jgi:hypothetical protein
MAHVAPQEKMFLVSSMAISGTSIGGTYNIKVQFIRPKFQGISPQNIAKNMVQYLRFRILDFPLTYG